MSENRSEKDSLLVALRKGQADKVRHIIKSSDVLNADTEADTAQNCLLHRAARYGHKSVVKVLVELKADANRRNKFGMTPLHHAAVAGDVNIVQILIESGSRASAVDDAGRSPLHWACANAYLEVAKILLEKGAKAELPDNEGFTPLHRVCQEKPPNKDNSVEREELSEEEIKLEHDREDEQRSEITQLLLKSGARVSTAEPKGLQTPLHLCCMNGYAKTGKVLIREGKASPDIQNKISQTPLMYACIEQHTELVKVILKYGNPTLEIPNILHWHWTALHWAVLQDNVEVVQALIDAGADSHSTDSVGRTPLKLAEEHFKENVQKILK